MCYKEFTDLVKELKGPGKDFDLRGRDFFSAFFVEKNYLIPVAKETF